MIIAANKKIRILYFLIIFAVLLSPKVSYANSFENEQAEIDKLMARINGEHRSGKRLSSQEKQDNKAIKDSRVYKRFLRDLKQETKNDSSKDFQNLIIKLNYLHIKAEKSSGIKQAIATTELMRFIDLSIIHLSLSNNDFGVQYFKKFKLNYQARKSEAIAASIKAEEEKSERAEIEREEREAAEEARQDIEAKELSYSNFLLRLKKLSNGNSTQALKILFKEVEELDRKLVNAVEDTEKSNIIREMKSHARNAMRFATESQLAFGIAYFNKRIQTAEAVEKAFMLTIEEKVIDAAALKGRLTADKEYRAELERIEEKIKTNIPGVFDKKVWGDSIWNFKIFDLQLRLRYKEIHIDHSQNNVIFMGQNDIKKMIITIEVIESSERASEAVELMTKLLLSHPAVYGVYFENELRIPTQLNKSLYETRSLGRGRVLLKPLVCSALFS